MTTICLASAGTDIGIWESIDILFVGFFMVLSILGILCLIMGGIGKLFTMNTPAPAAPTPVKSAVPAPVPAGGGNVPSVQDIRVVAAIAAAVDTVLGAGYEVVSIKPAEKSYVAWAQEGRRQIFQSHKIR